VAALELVPVAREVVELAVAVRGTISGTRIDGS
jgi:hypothetical protein